MTSLLLENFVCTSPSGRQCQPDDTCCSNSCLHCCESIGDLFVKSGSRVQLLKDKRSGSMSVLKTLDAGDMSRLELSIHQFLSQFDHPNILKLVNGFEQDGKVHLQLEFMVDGDLMQCLQRRQTLVTEDEVRPFILQILHSIKFVHDMGFCHLDISPENIFVDKRNHRVKLGDFGLARSSKSYFRTHSSYRPGKVNYMSPEIINDYDEIDGKEADMYAFGVTLFNLMFRAQPYSRPSDDDPAFFEILYGDFSHVLADFATIVDSKSMNLSSLEALDKSTITTGRKRKISQELADLLQGLICPVEERLNVDEALAHPWCSQVIV